MKHLVLSDRAGRTRLARIPALGSAGCLRLFSRRRLAKHHVHQKSRRLRGLAGAADSEGARRTRSRCHQGSAGVADRRGHATSTTNFIVSSMTRGTKTPDGGFLQGTEVRESRLGTRIARGSGQEYLRLKSWRPRSTILSVQASRFSQAAGMASTP
jgi:hypothetical protein